MATGTAPHDTGPSPRRSSGKSSGKFVEFDQYIDTQLRRTRGQVKSTEIGVRLLTLATGVLIFCLLSAIADHWLIRRGLAIWQRYVLFGGLIIGCGYFFLRTVLPALISRVNPIYAAQTIERSKPSLKNSLINFLLFRQQPETVHTVVFKAMEEQAATGLSQTHLETAVDRTRLIHFGYALIVCVAALALYLVLSPKNPLVSIYRVLAPWSDVAAPSRVSISNIEPADASAFRGQPIQVTADIEGLNSDEKALVIYSSADGQIVDRAIPMVAGDGTRQSAPLPEGKDGVQQDLTYRIDAGDTQSAIFHVKVIDAPTIVVDSVQYKYPDYTGIQPNPITVEHRGDLKAVEGTQVTIRAVANQPIKTAGVDFNCDGKNDISMKPNGQTATATFALSMNAARTGPLFNSYQLRMTNDRRLENSQPIRHQVEVVPDLPPEVAFLAPEHEEITVPLDGQVSLEVRAIDPDFALAEVRLRATSGRESLLDQSLLPDAPHSGPFVGKYQFVPAKLGLKAGDVVRYSAVATDNKAPQANETTTPERRIRITAAENLNPQQGDANQGATSRNRSQQQDGQPKQDNAAQRNPQDKNAGDQKQPQDQNRPQDHRKEENKQDGRGQQPESNQNQNPANNPQLKQNQEQQDQAGGSNQQTKNQTEQNPNQNGAKQDRTDKTDSSNKSDQKDKSDQKSSAGDQSSDKSPDKSN
ncbi:MAG TPA: hypothetical protein VGI75_15445, partial [Pirellulales bacterium]